MPTDTRLVLRPATAKDGETVIALINALAEYDKMPSLDSDAKKRLLRDAFEKKRFEMIIAEWEGKPAGYAVFAETYSTFEARPTLYMDDLFVYDQYRGRHIGYELFRYGLREAKRRDCGRMEWLVLDWNRPALGFYDHFGAQKLQKWVPFRLNREDIDKMTR